MLMFFCYDDDVVAAVASVVVTAVDLTRFLVLEIILFGH